MRQRNAVPSPDQHPLPTTRRGLNRLRECAFCGKPARHIDHIIPKARGGSSDRGNKIPLCAKCNLSKNDAPPLQFLKDLLKRNNLPFYDITPTTNTKTPVKMWRLYCFELAIYSSNERVSFELTYNGRSILAGDMFALILLGYSPSDFADDTSEYPSGLAQFLNRYAMRLGMASVLYNGNDGRYEKGAQKIMQWRIAHTDWEDERLSERSITHIANHSE